ncbi:MAG TPA: type II toxin-antitoxin system prevent-host-death family antitoxin [Verrucomicrobiota bacterium]|nr:type II toxin-antitoxin system prevent-host-death family antitoxin [Verrucomicrobiota bacterium]
MKTVSIRELHERTGEYVRQVARSGEIYVTDRGRTVARIVPEHHTPEVPYFARRKLTPAFRKLMEGGKLRGGTDSTQAISEEREERGA